jgi:16S rRNA (guanine(966)-N(2))-methyltransferase RsmD
MRIVGGAFGGRRLEVPFDERTRPMLEKTRGAVFNILGGAVAGARVLDLYSGTGALGLEALSRGAAWARFVERDRVALRCLRENIAAFGAGDRCEVEAIPVEEAVARAEAGGFALAFLDPPYRDVEDRARRRAILGIAGDLVGRVLAPGGLLVFHFPTGSVGENELPASLDGPPRRYGRNTIAIFRRPQE